MSSSLSDWQVAPELRPKPQDYGYDLDAALGSMVALRAIVPPEFPLAVADHLRDGGVVLDVDPEVFITRRRHKTGAQIAGIRRAHLQRGQGQAGGEQQRSRRKSPDQGPT